MALGLDLVVDLDQFALFIDDKGRTADPHIGFAHELALAPGTVLLAQLGLGIRQQIDLEPVFGDEFLVLRDCVLANAEDDGIDGGKIIDQRGKLVGLDGAARRVILGIEVKYDVLFAEILFQADAIAVLVDRGELRRGLVDFEHGVQLRQKKRMIKEDCADIKALSVRWCRLSHPRIASASIPGYWSLRLESMPGIHRSLRSVQKACSTLP